MHTDKEPVEAVEPTPPNPPQEVAPRAAAGNRRASIEERASIWWWAALFAKPLLLLVAGAMVIVALGVAQKLGFISAGSVSSATSAGVSSAARYICPMMCTPPQSEPGRCPVCAMELVAASSGGGSSDSRSVSIDPASRRVANIHTVAVEAAPMKRTIRAIGELTYDEGAMKTLSAYVDGRLDRLYADYTGAVVKKGDHLALVYSPLLYSGQVELLLAKKARDESKSATLARVKISNSSLYESALKRLLELGMTQEQIDQLLADGEATNRLHLCAPISGTIIEKLAAEGQYVKEGQAIYKLADLSTVWLMLELFPEDAVSIRYGQRVEAVVQSMPGKTLSGRVAFIDPRVDPKTRTVGVRVVISNADGKLKIGDYAKATIDVPVANSQTNAGMVYDPELANKWISPRHPHVVEDSAGKCRVCGVNLVPASQLGFVSEPTVGAESLVVPRDAVLMAGDNSVVYVETKPGRFEIRRVVLGPIDGDRVVIRKGVQLGEQVASRGNFLIDSQMQLAGNPSLIDPTRAEPLIEALTPAMLAEIGKLPATDQYLAESQRICPVTKGLLGSMGTPLKVEVGERTVFICCQGCESGLLAEPKKYLAMLDAPNAAKDDQSVAIEAALAKLDADDRVAAEKQRMCPVADMPLGSMGVPQGIDVGGVRVFICCEGCRESLLATPEEYLEKLARKESPAAPDSDGEFELPPIGVPEIIESSGDVPPIELPQEIAADKDVDSGVIR